MPRSMSASACAYAEALALMERGIVAGRGGEDDAAERAYREAIGLIAERGA